MRQQEEAGGSSELKDFSKSATTLIAEIDPQLPYMGGSATVDVSFFDLVITPPPPYPALFGLPRQPVGDADYAIGLYASTLVRDGGTLQIGIGSMGDALTAAFIADQNDLTRPTPDWPGNRIVYLQHASDPITWWNPDLLFAELPTDARILCVGVGTGTELAHLAAQNPGWPKRG